MLGNNKCNIFLFVTCLNDLITHNICFIIFKLLLQAPWPDLSPPPVNGLGSWHNNLVGAVGFNSSDWRLGPVSEVIICFNNIVPER